MKSNTQPDLTGMVSPQLREQSQRAANIHMLAVAAKKKIKNQRTGKFLVNAFFALILLSGLLFAYAKRDAILSEIKSRTGLDPLAVFLVPTQSPADTVVDCVEITVEIITEDDRQKLSVNPSPKTGYCYDIVTSSQTNWTNLLGSETELTRFAQYIYDKSDNHELSVDQIKDRLLASVGSWILDLRISEVQATLIPTNTPEPTVQPTTAPSLTPTPEATPIPEATPTPAVIRVVAPERELSLSLEELIQVMAEHNIQTVSGNNTGTTPQDRVRWALYYTIPSEDPDYLILSTINSPLPDTCVSGDWITISLIPTGLTNERWLTVGDYKIAFICE